MVIERVPIVGDYVTIKNDKTKFIYKIVTMKLGGTNEDEVVYYLDGKFDSYSQDKLKLITPHWKINDLVRNDNIVVKIIDVATYDDHFMYQVEYNGGHRQWIEEKVLYLACSNHCFKSGTRVQINKYVEGPYLAGTKGTVTEVYTTTIRVKLDSGNVIAIGIQYFDIIDKYYTGKIICVKSHCMTIPVGITFNVVDGVIDPHEWISNPFRGKRFVNLTDINCVSSELVFEEVKEEQEEDKTYNGKIYVVNEPLQDNILTKGKIYNVDKGRILADNEVIPALFLTPFEDFKDIQAYFSRFHLLDIIEVKDGG